MNIGTKVHVSYAALTTLMVAMAGTSAIGFSHLGSTVKRNLEERRVAVEAATGLLESLERQDSATLALIISSLDAESRDSMKKAEANFQKRLGEAERFADDEEKALIEGVRSHYDAYDKARKEFLEKGEGKTLALYEAGVFPTFWAAREDVFELLSLNFGSFVRADRQVQEAAIDNGIYLGIFITLALLGLIIVSVGMRRHLLVPLRDLAEFTEAVSRSPSRKRLMPKGSDELARVVRNLNDILDGRDSMAAEMEGRFSRSRQLLMGLLDHIGGAALVGMDGRLLAAAMPAEDQQMLEAALPELASRLKQDGDGRDRMLEHRAGPGPTVRLELLTALDRRPAGWLATLHR
jgi:hypothetical protein